MFHREVIKIPSKLRSIYDGRQGMQIPIMQNSQGVDISILEGVMGYYDGIATGTSGQHLHQNF